MGRPWIKDEGDLEMASAPIAQTSLPDPQAGSTEWTIKLKDEASSEMEQLMADTGLPFETLVRASITVLRILTDAKKDRQKVVITALSGRPLKQIVLPEL